MFKGNGDRSLVKLAGKTIVYCLAGYFVAVYIIPFILPLLIWAFLMLMLAAFVKRRMWPW
jgi:hypothetical protein